FYTDGAPVSAHDLGTDPQPEASPGIPLGADKRLEECVSDLRANAGSGITDSHAHSRPRSIVVFPGAGHTDFESTAAPDGIEGIGDQIPDHLAQFSGLAKNRCTFPKISFNRNFGSGQPRPI